MRWQGFRKVRGQVCRRIARRVRELGLSDLEAYTSYLNRHDGEWQVLDSFCRISISRFYRDRNVFQFLEHEILPRLSQNALAGQGNQLRCWSIGCASGEEPYTLALIWDFAISSQFPSLTINILASDADRTMIERAERSCYELRSMKDLPKEWIAGAFVQQKERFCIRQEERQKVQFVVQDIRSEMPPGQFHLILCRNLAFTYFDEMLQQEVLSRLRAKLSSGGALAIGTHESLPLNFHGFAAEPDCPKIFRKTEKVDPAPEKNFGGSSTERNQRQVEE